MTKSNEPRGSVSPSQFAEAIGRAMLTWQVNEAAAADLFAALIGARNREAALAAFYSVNGFSSRLAMLKNASRSLCATQSDFDDEELTTLLDRLTEANRLRNRLSHSVVQETFSDGVYQYFLEVPEAAWSGGKQPSATQKDRRIDAATVLAAETSFRQLAEDIQAFVDTKS